MNEACIGTVYDAKTAVLDLSVAAKLRVDNTKYGSWNTQQPWYGRITFNDGEWKFVSTLLGEDMFAISNKDIFQLIEAVLLELGK